MTATHRVETCEHGFERALCRDEQSAEVREAVDFAHGHAYEYAEPMLGCAPFDSRDVVEEFAAFVAAGVARAEGDLEGSLARDLDRFREATGR